MKTIKKKQEEKTDDKGCYNCKHHCQNGNNCDAKPCHMGSRWEVKTKSSKSKEQSTKKIKAKILHMIVGNIGLSGKEPNLKVTGMDDASSVIADYVQKYAQQGRKEVTNKMIEKELKAYLKKLVGNKPTDFDQFRIEVAFKYAAKWIYNQK